MLKRIAIIGSRKPKQHQVDFVKSFITSLDEDVIIISGCAKGIDTVGLETAFKSGIHTIGYIPFPGYKAPGVEFCNELISLSDVSVEMRDEAYKSVRKYHPVGNKLQKLPFLLHARSYLIVYNADLVIACPSVDKKGNPTGGTAQGIRVAKALKKEVEVIA